MDSVGYRNLRKGLNYTYKTVDRTVLLIDFVCGDNFDEFSYSSMHELKSLLPLTYCVTVYKQTFGPSRRIATFLNNVANIRRMGLSTPTLADMYRVGNLSVALPEIANELSKAVNNFYQKRGHFAGTTQIREIIQDRPLPLYLHPMELKTLKDMINWNFNYNYITYEGYTYVVDIILNTFDSHLGFRGRHQDVSMDAAFVCLQYYSTLLCLHSIAGFGILV